MHITRFDLLDATNHSNGEAIEGRARADASEFLRHAHEPPGHDKWFRAQVAKAIKEADAPDAKAGWQEKRADLVKRAGSNA